MESTPFLSVVERRQLRVKLNAIASLLTDLDMAFGHLTDAQWIDECVRPDDPTDDIARVKYAPSRTEKDREGTIGQTLLEFASFFGAEPEKRQEEKTENSHDNTAQPGLKEPAANSLVQGEDLPDYSSDVTVSSTTAASSPSPLKRARDSEEPPRGPGSTELGNLRFKRRRLDASETRTSRSRTTSSERRAITPRYSPIGVPVSSPPTLGVQFLPAAEPIWEEDDGPRETPDYDYIMTKNYHDVIWQLDHPGETFVQFPPPSPDTVRAHDAMRQAMAEGQGSQSPVDTRAFGGQIPNSQDEAHGQLEGQILETQDEVQEVSGGQIPNAEDEEQGQYPEADVFLSNLWEGLGMPETATAESETASNSQVKVKVEDETESNSPVKEEQPEVEGGNGEVVPPVHRYNLRARKRQSPDTSVGGRATKRARR